jgi:hypothetical protein
MKNSFFGDRNILKLMVVIVAQLHKFTKNHEPSYTGMYIMPKREKEEGNTVCRGKELWIKL